MPVGDEVEITFTDDGPGMRISESGAPSRQIDSFEDGRWGPASEILEIAMVANVEG